MAVLSMQKIRLFVDRTIAHRLLEEVQKLETVEFTEVPFEKVSTEESHATSFEFNRLSSRLDALVIFLSKFKPSTQNLRTILEGENPFVNESSLESIPRTFDYRKKIEYLENLETSLNQLRTKYKELTDERALLLPWKSLPLSLHTSLESKYTKTILLSIPEEVLGELDVLLDEKGVTYHIEEYPEKKYVLTFLNEDEASTQKVLHSLSLEALTLPRRRGTPAEEIERIDRAQKHIEEEERETIKKIEAELVHLPELKTMADITHWKKERHTLLTNSGNVFNNISILEGWCPKRNLKALEQSVTHCSRFSAIEPIDPEPGETPPVEIRNHPTISPFESVTRLYGLPGKDDLDPTIFLSVFFFVFFGLSLTDVGYGILLTLITGSLLLFYRVKKGTRLLIQLLFLGGIAAVAMGALFGGYLGVDLESLPQALQGLQVFNPVENPLPVLYLSLILGVLQIMFGLTLKIVREIKNKNTFNGILDQLPWLLLFVSFIWFILEKLALIPQTNGLATGGILFSALFIVLSQGRHEKGIIKKASKGVLSLYDIVGYFSDILSYSRILALGLATSALAFAVNLIAFLLKDMIPVVGGVLMVVVLIVGHLFNLAINILGAFIHSARLQFVEFFGKFITGSGRTFNPFTRKTRFIELIK